MNIAQPDPQALTRAITNDKWYDFLEQPFQTAHMQTRGGQIDQALHDNSTTSYTDNSEMLAAAASVKAGASKAMDPSMYKPSDKRRISTMLTDNDFQVHFGADYFGLRGVYEYDVDSHGEEKARAHALELLGDDEALLADFEKKMAYDKAINTLIWSSVEEYEPNELNLSKSLAEHHAKLTAARDTVFEGLAEAGIGKQIAFSMLQNMKDQIALLAKSCGHGQIMTPQ